MGVLASVRLAEMVRSFFAQKKWAAAYRRVVEEEEGGDVRMTCLNGKITEDLE